MESISLGVSLRWLTLHFSHLQQHAGIKLYFVAIAKASRGLCIIHYQQRCGSTRDDKPPVEAEFV